MRAPSSARVRSLHAQTETNRKEKHHDRPDLDHRPRQGAIDLCRPLRPRPRFWPERGRVERHRHGCRSRVRRGRRRHRGARRMRTVFLAAALLPALAAAGCSLVPYGAEAQRAIETAVDTGIDDRRAYNDKKAEVLPVLACDISVGAYGRMAESDVKRGVALICGLDRGQAVASDLNAAAAIMDALSRLQDAQP